MRPRKEFTEERGFLPWREPPGNKKTGGLKEEEWSFRV